MLSKFLAPFVCIFNFGQGLGTFQPVSMAKNSAGNFFIDCCFVAIEVLSEGLFIFVDKRTPVTRHVTCILDLVKFQVPFDSLGLSSG